MLFPVNDALPPRNEALFDLFEAASSHSTGRRLSSPTLLFLTLYGDRPGMDALSDPFLAG
jgi:hypothetical protein